jgi:hypothetical protein
VATSRKYDLHSPEFRATTHATYALMREQDPVLLQPGLDGETPISFLTRDDDVVSALLDDERLVLDPALALSPEELEQREASSPLPVDERINAGRPPDRGRPRDDREPHDQCRVGAPLEPGSARGPASP